MQHKGAIRLLAILLGLTCLYQLSFTVVTRIHENKAQNYAATAVEQFKQTPEYAAVDDDNKEFVASTLGNEREKYYLDSIAAEKVYFAFTFKEVKEKELNLGLDLRGGMNVMLEVSVVDIVKTLANQNSSPEFQQALNTAIQKQNTSGGDFISLLSNAWDEAAPGRLIADEFSYELQYVRKQTGQLSNSEVLAIIRADAESAIDNSYRVLRNRITGFGVSQPNIQRLPASGRILVELPGVKEPERVRKLLQGTASLEFWTTYENRDIYTALEDANRIIKEMQLVDQSATTTTASTETTDVATTDTTNTTDDLISQIAQQSDSTAAAINMEKDYPLFAVLKPSQSPEGACIGYAHYRDTSKINAWLRLPQIQSLFPRDFVPMWTAQPSPLDKSGTTFELVAIKNTADGKAPLDGGAVTDARKVFGNSGSPEVDMHMNAEGSQIWARLTADNVGKQIAVVLDGAVYSYPRVIQAITGGRSQITGTFTITETDDLANVLKSGKLPAPARIVQEAVVGPSLGQESINSGLISFFIAFLLVLAYMLFFYNYAGIVSNIALTSNLLLLLGVLVSFGATLTLPGIAGIVLTMGMAVDANVIIYERVKEEIRAGKGLRLAIADGYKNAYSAIIDGNLTTIITGLVLAFSGSGPVKGFAITLIIGIITSLFTSIFITRLLFEARLNRNKNITFDNKLTHNFLANTKIDFVKIRKYAYIASATVCIIGAVSIFTKGFTYGVDFTGGRTYVVRFDQPVLTNDIRTSVIDIMEGSSTEVKQFGNDNQVKITTTFGLTDETQAVDSILFIALGDFFKQPITFPEFISTLENPNGIISSEVVGPTIASDIKRNAVIAVFISMIAIFLYIAARFRNWYWGLGGLISLAHDALVVVGFFSIFSGILPFNLDIDQTFIAAILTVIGYSINDTVVIFDRIREYRVLYPKQDIRTNINMALNSTLSRTVNTGGTTLVVLLAIAIFGGEVIRGFSVALIIGVIVGTYSSIFVGTPIVLDMYRKKLSKKQ